MDGHWNRRLPYDGLGSVAEQKPRHPSPIVCSDDDPVDVVVFRVRHDRSDRTAVFERRRYGHIRSLSSRDCRSKYPLSDVLLAFSFLLALATECSPTKTVPRLAEATGVENGYLRIGEPSECELQCGGCRLRDVHRNQDPMRHMYHYRTVNW